MNVRFFNPAKQNQKYRKELDQAYKNVIEGGDLILRQDVEDFEKKLCEFTGAKYAVALNSCTDALYLSLRYFGIGPGDEVLVPSRTFVATPQVIVQLGATPVFYDLDGIYEITDKTKAIIPVHIEGVIDEDIDMMVETAKLKGIPVIEDAAQALGARLYDKHAGTFGTTGCFSFYPAKILGCLGDGGALITDDKEVYEWVKEARNHFKYTAKDWGVNSRLDNLQAAFLNVKIDDLPGMLQKRANIAKFYDDNIREHVDLELPEATEGRVYQDYIIRTSQRDELYEFLQARGIETMKNNYPFPVPKLPEAQRYEDETLRLPCNDVLELEEVNYVVEQINEFFQD
jgi:dTDP-4-amino-4,6-dideoxygalactose transaminase